VSTWIVSVLLFSVAVAPMRTKAVPAGAMAVTVEGFHFPVLKSISVPSSILRLVC